MEVTAYDPGTPSFIDLATSDLQGAKAFYSALMGWEAIDMPMPQGGVYTMLQKNGRDVAGAYEIWGEMAEMGVPPHWVTYITVADVDAAAVAVAGSGGTILQEPFDVMSSGRMAAAQDPTGASFNMWQARESIGSYLTREPGTLMWNELQTDDVEAAADFYADVFGWKTQVDDMENGPYTTFLLGEAAVAGMMEIQPEWGQSHRIGRSTSKSRTQTRPSRASRSSAASKRCPSQRSPKPAASPSSKTPKAPTSTSCKSPGTEHIGQSSPKGGLSPTMTLPRLRRGRWR